MSDEELTKVWSAELQSVAKFLHGAMQEGFAQLNARMDRLEQRMDKLEQRMDGLEQRMDKLEQRTDKLEVEVRLVVKELRGFRHDTRGQFHEMRMTLFRIDNRVSDHEEKFFMMESQHLAG
jgi:chromosome segregation ATPase